MLNYDYIKLNLIKIFQILSLNNLILLTIVQFRLTKTDLWEIGITIFFCELILIHKSGRQERDFVFVGDVCKKLLKEIYKKDTKQEIVINTNKFLRVLDIKNLLQKISQKKIEYSYIATPKGYDDKIYSKPIMKINNNFMKNLELTYNWYKSF